MDWVNVQTQQGPSPARGLLPLSLPILPSESHTYWTSLASVSARPPGINFLSALTPVALGNSKVLPYKKTPTYRSAGHDCHPLPSLETSLLIQLPDSLLFQVQKNSPTEKALEYKILCLPLRLHCVRCSENPIVANGTSTGENTSIPHFSFEALGIHHLRLEPELV